MKRFFNINKGLVLVVAFLLSASGVAGQKSFTISKQFDVLHALFRELDQYYVDSLAPETVLTNSINGLMSSYDPYTNYISESETDEFKIMTTGEYGGVGAIIGQRKGKVLIIEPYEHMPAQKAGLLAGDELVEIGGVKITAEDSQNASELLKGEPGTEVEVVVKREGTKGLIKKKLIRELVQINPVTYYGIVAPGIGYLNLNSFTENASEEVQRAFTELKAQGAVKLVLDLRGNGGGLLNEAVDICNLFVNKGQEIVSTKGKLRQWDQIYKTTREPVDTVIPIVVMVNSGSASSSEILCGSLQDLDRAVVLGTRTFGKGLVQTTRSIPYNGVLKITTAKYYIPSGRCIQAIDYANRNKDGSVGRIPDSLIHEFRTSTGRLVKDGGGIEPDILCRDSRGSAISYSLMDGMYFFNYANLYFRKHEKIGPLSSFKLSQSDLDDFMHFIEEDSFTYENESYKALKNLKQVMQEEGLLDPTISLMDSLESRLKTNLEVDFKKYREEIELLLSIEIANRYYYQSGELQQSLKFDPCLKEAIKVLDDKSAYLKILNRQEPGKNDKL